MIREKDVARETIGEPAVVSAALGETPAIPPTGLTYRRAAVRGLGWLAVLQVISTLVSQVTTVVLAILLLPSDFGIYGSAMIALTLIAIPGDLGLTIELVQRKDLDSAFSTALRLRWAVALVLAMTALFSGPVFARLLGAPVVIPILAVMSLMFPGAALGFAPRVVLTRRLDFRRIAIADLVGKLAGPVTAVWLALVGLGYWSLVLGLIASQWAGSLAASVFVHKRPKGPFSGQLARKLVSFGKFISLSTLVGYLLSTADNIAAVTAFGVISLGYYALAYSFAVTIPRNIASMVETVTFPIFAKIATEVKRLRQGYLLTLRFVSYFAFPIATGLVVFAPTLVDELLGAEWSTAGLLMSPLALAGLMYALSVPSSALLYAIGRPKSVTIATTAGAVTLVLLLSVSVVLLSLPAISLAAVGGAMVYLVVLSSQSMGAIRLDLRALWGSISQPIVAATAAGACSGLALRLLTPTVFGIVFAAAIGVTLYVLISQLVSRGEFLRSIWDIATMAVR